MLKGILRLKQYFIALILLLLAAAIFNSCFAKAEAFFLLNTYHPSWLDEFFKLITNFGDGLFNIVVVAVLLFFGKKKKATTVLLSYATSGLVAQGLKRIFHMPRPKIFLEEAALHYPNFVEGVNLYGSNSFPSGHTTSAFALATAIVLVYKKKRISFYALLFAVLIGYSRIYLAQHFLQDVLLGAIIGTIFALISYYQVYDQKLFRSYKVNKRYKRLRAFRKQALTV